MNTYLSMSFCAHLFQASDLPKWLNVVRLDKKSVDMSNRTAGKTAYHKK